MFLKTPASENEKYNFPSTSKICDNTTAEHQEANETEHAKIINYIPSELRCEKDENVAAKENTPTENYSDDYDFFKRPDVMELNMFFNHHPVSCHPKKSNRIAF
ncbi:hypothetical protein Zmor_026294 [Zophobas morio]|uniref:Uncharacterized protein n=1 Tax=Zophobas morio TaxID=2755281 RepID=A0AA38HTR5_9CUCU|nr:hypothetical protein Zmor_026294 [Zophobas morio]